MDRFATSLCFLLISCWLCQFSSCGSLDLEEFALDIFGDKSAAEMLKRMPDNAIGELSGKCKDYSSSCAKYRSHCTNKVVLRFCKVTCRVCSNKPDVPKIIMTCQDDRRMMCGLRKSQCEPYKEQMKRYCPKTCGFCEEDQCKDTRDKDYCNAIKKGKFCTRLDTVRLASRYCKKTCKLCSKDIKCGKVRVHQLNKTEPVIAGKSAVKGYWPWQVAIYYRNKYHCGGSLINEDTILSAAHCFFLLSRDPSQYHVVLGDHNKNFLEGTEQKRMVSRLTLHENFHDDIFNDIALLKLTEKMLPTDFVVPICLPENDSPIKVGTKCYVTGWGKVAHPGKSVSTLQQAKISVVSKADCKKKNDRGKVKVTDNMICAGELNTFRGACHGDSGGPFVCQSSKGKWELRGIVSWGSPECNSFLEYSVFTRVSKYLYWIKKNMS